MDDIPMGPNREEILKALDEIVDVNYEPVSRGVGKRSSILKPPKSDDGCTTEDLNKRKSLNLKRRVSFADKFQVMEMCTGNIYDVPGKNKSESPMTTNEGSDGAKSEDVFSEGILDKSMSHGLSPPNIEELSPNRKHKLISDPDSEPDKKRPASLQFFASQCPLPADVFPLPSHKISHQYQKIKEQESKEKNFELPFLQTTVTQTEKVLSFQNEQVSANKSTLNLNDTEVIQGILNCKNMMGDYESDGFLSSTKKNNVCDDSGFSVMKEEPSFSNFCPAVLPNFPLLQDKENVYIDVENKNILVANSRHRDVPLLKEISKCIDLGVPKLKETTPMSSHSKIEILTLEENCIKNTVILHDSEKSKLEKTVSLSQRMDLTCIMPDTENLNESQPSSSIDSREDVSFQNSKKNDNLNVTKLHPEEMEITCIGANASLENSVVDNSSIGNYITNDEIPVSSGRFNTYVEEDMQSDIKNNLELTFDDLLRHIREEKPAMGKTNLSNPTMDITCGAPQPEIVEVSSYVDKDRNSEKENKLTQVDVLSLNKKKKPAMSKTNLSIKTMDFTCIVPQSENVEEKVSVILSDPKYHIHLHYEDKTMESNYLNPAMDNVLLSDRSIDKKANFMNDLSINTTHNLNIINRGSSDELEKYPNSCGMELTCVNMNHSDTDDKSSLTVPDTTIDNYKYKNRLESCVDRFSESKNGSNPEVESLSIAKSAKGNLREIAPVSLENEKIIPPMKENYIENSTMKENHIENSTVLHDVVKSKPGKTVLLNQTMDLTCITPDSENPDASGTSLSVDSSENDAYKRDMCSETQNIQNLGNEKKPFNLNRTTFHLEEMEITCIGVNTSLVNSAEDSSNGNCITNDEIPNSSPIFINYVEKDTHSQNVNDFKLPSSDILGHNVDQKRAMSKTTLSNPTMDFTCVVPQSEIVEVNSSVEKDTNSEKQNVFKLPSNDILGHNVNQKSTISKTNLSNPTMDFTCVAPQSAIVEVESYVEKDTNSEKENVFKLTNHDISGHSLRQKVAMSKTTLSNTTMDFTCVVPQSDIVEVDSHVEKDTTSEKENVFKTLHSDVLGHNVDQKLTMSKTTLSNPTMDFTCVVPQSDVVRRTDNVFQIPNNSFSTVYGDITDATIGKISSSASNIDKKANFVSATKNLALDVSSYPNYPNSIPANDSDEHPTTCGMELTCLDINQLDVVGNSYSSPVTDTHLENNMKDLPTDYVDYAPECKNESTSEVRGLSIMKSGQEDVIGSVSIFQNDVSLSPDKPTSSRVSISRRQSFTKDGCETDLSVSFTITTRENCKKPSKIETDKYLVRGTDSETKKRTLDSGQSGIIYAIKKLKAMNQLNMVDVENSVIPEFLSSLRKQPKPFTTFSHTRVNLSKEVRDAIRQSYSFNLNEKELSFIAEVDVRRSPSTSHDQKNPYSIEKSVCASKLIFNSQNSIQNSQYTENIEQFVKNNTENISKCFIIEESSSILNNVSYVHDNYSEISNLNTFCQNVPEKQGTPIINPSLRISPEKMISPPVLFKNRVDEEVPEDLMLDDVFTNEIPDPVKDFSVTDISKNQDILLQKPEPLSNSIVSYTLQSEAPTIAPVVIVTDPSVLKSDTATTKLGSDSQLSLISPTLQPAKVIEEYVFSQSTAEALPTQIDVPKVLPEKKTVITEIPKVPPQADMITTLPDHNILEEAAKVPNTSTEMLTREDDIDSATVPGNQALARNLFPQAVLNDCRNSQVTPFCAANACNFTFNVPDTPTTVPETPFVRELAGEEAFPEITKPEALTADTAPECGTSWSDDEEAVALCPEEKINIYKIIKQFRKRCIHMCKDSKKWRFVAIDDEHAEFVLMWRSSWACYKMLVPLHLYEDTLSDRISFTLLREKGGDLVDVDNLGLALMMCRLSNDLGISPFSPEKLEKKMPVYVKAAMEAKSIMEDMWNIVSIFDINIEYNDNISTIEAIGVLSRGAPFAMFTLKFQVDLLTYPNEKIKVIESKHMKYNPIEFKVIVDTLNTVEPGKNYLHRMVDAARAINNEPYD